MKTRAATVALVLVALAYIVLGVNRGLSIYDEAIPVVAATRILDGDRPYRDFWVIYPPGQLYLLAGVFKVLGTSLIVSRLASVAAILGTSILMYTMARQLRLPVPLAILPAGLWTAVVGAVSGATLGAGIFTALLLGLGSAMLFLQFLQGSRRTWLAMSGLALGFTFLFRHDIAAYLLIAEVTFFVAGIQIGAHRDLVRALGSLGLYLGAVAGPVAVAVAILGALGVPAGDLVEDLVRYPFTGYASARSLPLPALIPDTAALRAGRMSIAQYAGSLRNGLRFYFPIAVFVISLAVLFVQNRAKPATRASGEGRPVAFACLIGLALLPYAWVRSDIPHIVPSWFPGLLLFAWLLRQLPVRGGFRAAGLAVAAVWSVVFTWGAVVAKTEALVEIVRGPSGLALDSPRGTHIIAGSEAAPMQAALKYVQAVVPADERIFVGNARHDNLVLNDVMFYFLAGRRSGTRYHELVPGVATTSEVQARIVQDLERHRVRYVVLRADPGYAPSPDGGADVLDRFIRERFDRYQVFGNYSLWRKREERS